MGNHEGESRLYVASISKYKCINLSQELNSILWDRINHGVSIDDVMELYCDISQLDVMSNLEIDAAKRENPANNTRELQWLKKKYDVRDEKNRHIRPLFFKYIDDYKGYRDNYYVYLENGEEFTKLCRTDKYKEAQEFKKHSENKIIVERGRMSYKMHLTSMDYLQKCIDKIYVKSSSVFIPRAVESNHGLSYVLLPAKGKKDGASGSTRLKGKDMSKAIEPLFVDLISTTKKDIQAIWNNDKYTSQEKRKFAHQLKEKCATELMKIKVNEVTMRNILSSLEEKHPDIARYLFFTLAYPVRGFMLSCLHRVIEESIEPVDVLQEDVNGDIHIYDFKYLRVHGQKEEYNLYFENQLEFAEYVRGFIEKYGIRQDWIATQLEIERATLSQFLSVSGHKDMSKANCFNLFSFIKKYEEGMKWLELA